MGTASCFVCQKTAPRQHHYCPRCRRLVGRRFNRKRGRKRDRVVPVPSRAEWVPVLRGAYDPGSDSFLCGITGVPLTVSDPNSPLYATHEHLNPGCGSGGWAVVSALVNDMKSDMSLEEFRTTILLTGEVFRGREGAVGDLAAHLHGLKHFRRTLPEAAASPTEMAVSATETQE